jgi:hypothetical protein
MIKSTVCIHRDNLLCVKCRDRTFRDTIMPMIRVQDWTKERLEEIKDEEDHTSLDSVIKTLLKERANETTSTNE